MLRGGHSVSGNLGAGEDPDEEDDDGDRGGSQESGGPKGPARAKEILDLRQLKRLDVVDIAGAGLWLGVHLVLGDDVLQRPARELPQDGDDTAGAVLPGKSVRRFEPYNMERRGTHLSMVAVDEKRVVLAVQDDAKDRPDGLDRDLFLLGALHVKDSVLDVVVAEELLVSRREVLLHQGAAQRVRSKLKKEQGRGSATYMMVFSLRRPTKE